MLRPSPAGLAGPRSTWKPCREWRRRRGHRPPLVSSAQTFSAPSRQSAMPRISRSRRTRSRTASRAHSCRVAACARSPRAWQWNLGHTCQHRSPLLWTPSRPTPSSTPRRAHLYISRPPWPCTARCTRSLKYRPIVMSHSMFKTITLALRHHGNHLRGHQVQSASQREQRYLCQGLIPARESDGQKILLLGYHPVAPAPTLPWKMRNWSRATLVAPTSQRLLISWFRPKLPTRTVHIRVLPHLQLRQQRTHRPGKDVAARVCSTIGETA